MNTEHYPIRKCVLRLAFYDEEKHGEAFVFFMMQKAYQKMQKELAGRRVQGPIWMEAWVPSDKLEQETMAARGETRYYYMTYAWDGPPITVPFAAYAQCALCFRDNVFVIADHDDVGICEDCIRFNCAWPEYVRPKDPTMKLRIPQ